MARGTRPRSTSCASLSVSGRLQPPRSEEAAFIKQSSRTASAFSRVELFHRIRDSAFGACMHSRSVLKKLREKNLAAEGGELGADQLC